MVSKTQIKRALRFAKPILATRFDERKVQDLLEVMQANYKELEHDIPTLHSRLNKMTLKIAVDALAYYRMLLTVLPEDEALSLLQPFINNWMDGQFDTWFNRKVYANRRAHLLYRRA